MTTQRSGNPWPRNGPPNRPGEPPYAAAARRSRGVKKQRSARTQSVLKILHVLAFVLGPVLLLSIAAAAIGYVRLLHGPISLKSFSKTIEASINKELDGFTADIDDAVITLAADYKVELRLINLRLNETSGDLVASAPLAAVELKKSALWRLEAAPERVYLIEPRLAVVYNEGQGFSLNISNASQEVAPDAPAGEPPPLVPPQPVPAVNPNAVKVTPGQPLPPSFHRIDLARILAESSARARGGSAATSSLREFGVRNALVSISYEGEISDINVVEASVDLEHMKRRSVISGTATVASSKGPWSLSFRTEETARKDILKVTTTVHDFVPSTLAKVSPGLGLLDMFDAPVTGQLGLDLSTAGDLHSASLGLELGHGYINLPSLSATPLLLDGGRVSMTYDAQTRRLNLAPSTLDWGESKITLEGAIFSDPAAAGEPQWQFDVRSTGGVLAAGDFGVAPFPIDSFTATGRMIPSEGLIQLARLSLAAGGGEVTANGEVIAAHDAQSMRMEAAVSPMPLATLKAMWPRAAAPAARSWVGEQVEAAVLKSASLKILSGKFLDGSADENGALQAGSGARVSASIDFADLRMIPLPRALPIEAPRASIRLENSSLEVNVPDAAIVAGPTQRLPLKDARLTVVDVSHEAPIAELALKSQTTLPVLIEALNRSQLHLTGQGPLLIDGINGNVDGDLKISMPLVSGANVVKAEGKARITNIKGKTKEHKLDLQGGTIEINVSDIGVIAKGDLIVNGVVAKIQMQRILDAPVEMQPPLRISATLDNSDRTQLGLDVNHLVQGEMPVEITLAQKPDNTLAVHFRADLTNAELLFEDVAWRKVPGRSASLEFDVSKSETVPDNVDLKNFRLVGDNIAIEGSMVIDDTHEVSEFSFPNFSLNVVSRLDVRGKINNKRIWTIGAKGSTFDAKDLFRSLLALGNTSDAKLKPLKPAAGVDFSAEIDTVLGHSDVSLRGFTLKVTDRNQQVVAMEARGTLDGGKPLAAVMKPDAARKFTAETADAGQAFKLIGFYPNMQGGRAKIDVNLDARGAAEKSGVLWVEDFRVLGDPIVAEVYSSVEAGGAEGGPKKRVEQREVFDFQRMKVPFSVGHGQFVMDDSYVRGPLLGASIRGKVDYNTRRVNLGGTYVPLQGINAAVCDIPLFGPIVAGFDCQGVFGITYAIQGPMSQPQVLVNPLSMFTPGILRGIMEMTNTNPQVQAPRDDKRGSAEDRVRASSSNDKGGAIDGWSSETKPNKKKQ